MKKSNLEIENMLIDLRPLLERKGVTGMVAARNTRILSDLVQEYAMKKQELIVKYGTPSLDTNGNETDEVSVVPGTEGFDKLLEELTPFAELEHEFNVMTVPIEKVMDDLTGAEMLALEWMLEE